MLADIHLEVRKSFRQDLVEPVVADEAPGASDLGVKIDLQHAVVFSGLILTRQDDFRLVAPCHKAPDLFGNVIGIEHRKAGIE